MKNRQFNYNTKMNSIKIHKLHTVFKDQNTQESSVKGKN